MVNSQKIVESLPSLVYSGWTGGNKKALENCRNQHFKDIIDTARYKKNKKLTSRQKHNHIAFKIN